VSTKPCPCGSSDHLAPDPAPARIWFVRFWMADGREIKRWVRCPYISTDPAASPLGLESRLAWLKFHRRITKGSANPSDNPKHLKECERARAEHVPGHRCECFPRWTEIPELAAA
jgi:hypothetical protein